jgi:alkaline phosphatase D
MFSFPRHLIALLPLALLAASAHLQADIAAGPMLGHIDMREAIVWVQTDTPAKVRVAYVEQGQVNGLRWSDTVETDNALNNTATLSLNTVEPGKKYNYRIELDGKLTEEQNTFNTPANYLGRTPPPDLRIAVGGAHYVTEEGFEPPYQILGGGYGIFSTILAEKPELMIWAGNTAHLRDSDWASKSGTLKRFAKARGVSELHPLLASIPHYGTWSSADYGTENAGKYYSYRQHAEDSFKAYWPQPVEIASLDGITTRFRRSDVDFFMLDTRSYRDDAPASDRLPQMLGKEQIEWLRQEIINSTATFKVIIAGAPILNPADNRSNLSYAEREHSNLLQMLRNERISGLFFISGGKYYGELTRLVHANSYNLFDLTLGPLTANPKDNEDELNFFRMPGSSTFERHFALLDFTGPEEDRAINIRVMSMEGTELWQRTIKASQLQPAEK